MYFVLGFHFRSFWPFPMACVGNILVVTQKFVVSAYAKQRFSNTMDDPPGDGTRSVVFATPKRADVYARAQEGVENSG